MLQIFQYFNIKQQKLLLTLKIIKNLTILAAENSALPTQE